MEHDDIPEEIEFSESFKPKKKPEVPIDNDIEEELPVSESQDLKEKLKKKEPKMSKVVDETYMFDEESKIPNTDDFTNLYKIINGRHNEDEIEKPVFHFTHTKAPNKFGSRKTSLNKNKLEISKNSEAENEKNLKGVFQKSDEKGKTIEKVNNTKERQKEVINEKASQSSKNSPKINKTVTPIRTKKEPKSDNEKFESLSKNSKKNPAPKPTKFTPISKTKKLSLNNSKLLKGSGSNLEKLSKAEDANSKILK